MAQLRRTAAVRTRIAADGGFIYNIAPVVGPAQQKVTDFRVYTGNSC